MKSSFSLPVILLLLLSSIFSCTSPATPAGQEAADSMAAQKTERGRYLVETVGSCMHCHSQRDFTKLAGPLKEETKGMGGVAYPKFGQLYSSNITPDSATGIGAWTDDEIARAITQGIARNGDTLSPVMPYYEYNNMCREDVYSIVAYLRSLPPIVNPLPPHRLKTPAGLDRAAFTFSAAGSNPLPPAADTIAVGRYLAAVGACVSCHTPKTEDDHLIMDSAYAGGDMMGQKFGFHVNSSNITPDTATGIGKWTETAFLDKFKSFRHKEIYAHDPGKHNTLMPWTFLAQMKDEDLKAVYAYLRTVKPIHHVVEKWPHH